MSSSTIRLDAVRMIKTVLAGTATQRFLDVIEAVFGGEEEKSIRDEMEAEEGIPLDVKEDDDDEEKEEEPEGDKASTSTLFRAMKRKAPPPTTNPKKSALPPKTPAVCSLEQASIIYPSLANKDGYLQAGVDDRFISSRKSSSVSKRAGYGCQYNAAMRQDGVIVEDCDFVSSVRRQLCTHIRRAHLGAAVVCFICDKHWWSSSTWLEHMEKTHTTLQRDDYFIKEGSDITELKATFTIKEEVDPDDL